jgi:hypothetical protein
MLHQDLVGVQTTSSTREKRAQQISKGQKQDYEELKFVNSQLLIAMDLVKNKSEGDRRKMEDALQRHGIIGEKGGDKRAIDVGAVLQKLQKIDIETVRLMFNVKRDWNHLSLWKNSRYLILYSATWLKWAMKRSRGWRCGLSSWII